MIFFSNASKKFFAVTMLLCFTAQLEGETYLERVEKLKKTESAVDLYGRIVDQDERPVAGATVKYEIARYGLLKPHYTHGELVSDGEGLFELHAGKGGILYIKNIECTGHEYKLLYAPGNKNVTSFEFRSTYRDRHRADKEHPVVWHLRRKDSKGNFILYDNLSIELSTDDGRDWSAYDFGTPMTGIPSRRTRNEYFWDIEATGEADKENGVWNVILKTNGEKSGIQRLDQLLYEAPADGYARELLLTIPFGTQKQNPITSQGDRELSIRHFYARLREPGMYARLDVEVISADESKIIMYCNALINPYGERRLEKLIFLMQKLSDSEQTNADIELKNKMRRSQSLYFDNCEKPAMQAMREQRFAVRPPFEEWIKDGLAFW